ncbi:hypothetical protein [Caproicibacter sp.]|uniref:hypothetical protein n=1 Tax=Caproicibacter sp. TaxID=2814884 RepID=UPI003989F06B
MDAGLLFYCSRRTSVCEKLIRRSAGWFQLPLVQVRVCTREERLNPNMAALLKDAAAVFVVSEAVAGRPLCSAALFRTLRVPIGGDGEPAGVLKLAGRETTGYLVESQDRAILILPDDPSEILEMLPAAFERLKKKFGLSGEIPKQKEIRFVIPTDEEDASPEQPATLPEPG